MTPPATDLNREPPTEHFTPAELAEFLDQLARLHPEECGQNARSPRASGSQPTRRHAGVRTHVEAFAQDPETVVDSGHLLAVGALRRRTRVVRHGLLEGDALRVRRDERVEPPRWLRRSRVWRRAFVVVALSSLLLLLVLSLRAFTHAPANTRARRPPALPAPVFAGIATAPLRSADSLKPVPSESRELEGPLVLRTSDKESAAARAPTQLAARMAASSRPHPAARRKAVDLLLSGRSRAALDAYRVLLSSSPTAQETDALEHVVRVLAREQDSCARKLGSSCGI